MSYYLGIDIGGTNIAFGVVDENLDIIGKSKIKTGELSTYEEIINKIIKGVDLALESCGLDISHITWIGIGSPGAVNPVAGTVEYANNIGFDYAPVGKDVEDYFGVKTYIDNDANVAAVAEFFAGAAQGHTSGIVLTLGTGVGSGIIIDGKVYRGVNFAGGEIGHTVIQVDGYPCTCGRKGCLESYASATGLIRLTKEAIEIHPESGLANYAKEQGKISARTAFNAAKLGDEVAEKVVDSFITYLACGVANCINIFQPDIICIGGGVGNEGDNLLIPLKERVYRDIYTKNFSKNTEIQLCQLGNEAGIIGAAMLGNL